MDYLAHSKKTGIPAQTYVEHIDNVRRLSEQNAAAAARYSRWDGDALVYCASISAEFHDLGKLDFRNQEELHKTDSSSVLPVNHVDAGSAALKSTRGEASLPSLMVYSHHRGLPNLSDEEVRGKDCFRNGHAEIRHLVDDELEDLLRLHTKLTGRKPKQFSSIALRGDPGVYTRMQLSCLTDADHTDTAIHYGNYPEERAALPLRAAERLVQLNDFVAKLGGDDERSSLRKEMYRACRDSTVSENIAACDSPVGSGKTTAVMAHLLRQAVIRRSRRIFVVLPFTNIISQSVRIYREALTLPGENPENVVSELHHRADFENEEARAFCAQWRAPIIVTTAVAFFETLASNRPAALRRLHELPGSVIFLDEAHAALPVKLIPIAWRWMQIFADQWGCYWVMASGSLVKFWTLTELRGTGGERYVPQIVCDELRKKLSAYEHRRIRFSVFEKPLGRAELANAVNGAPGPRMLIMNTVQSAAIMADDMRNFYGQDENAPLKDRKVLHLSTALNAEDRERIIGEVKARLAGNEDTDWTLVATSCVEAGVDFSFRTGFREVSSLLSLLQAAGRVGREGEYDDAIIWSFSMQDDRMLTQNSMVADAAYVLKRYFLRGIEITPQLSTRAVQDELNRIGTVSAIETILQAERNQSFEDVETQFRVIETESALVIADPELKRKIRSGYCDWREIQRKGISVHLRSEEKRSLPLLADGLYDWNLRYNDFLGVMAGRLDCLRVGLLGSGEKRHKASGENNHFASDENRQSQSDENHQT